MSTQEPTARDVLLRAAEWLAEHGWTQRVEWRDSEGLYTTVPSKVAKACAVGAIVLCSGPNGRFMPPAMDALRAHLGGCVSIWNDHPTRTKDEVINALKAAAEASE